MTEKNALVKQIKRIAGPRPEKGQIGEICLYNKIVLGMQNYYRIATRTKAIWQIGNLADEPIYPIGYVQFKIPMGKSNKRQAEEIDEIKLKLLRQPLYKRSIEYSDNRLSLYLAQKGKCAVTGKNFTFIEESAVKVACTVWSGGKLGDYFKELPITMPRKYPQNY